MKTAELAGDQYIAGYFPGHTTAGTAKECTIGRAPFAGTITAVTFLPATAITGAATNYFTLNVRNRAQDGAGTKVPAALAFSNGVNASVHDEKTITLSATASDLTVAAGDIITVEKAVSGTGLACPDGLVVVTFRSLGG